MLPRCAEISKHLAPGDPKPRWLAATAEKGNFSSESLDKSVALFETVVQRSPYDFRWWIELGRAYEQAEKPENAEVRLRTSGRARSDIHVPALAVRKFLSETEPQRRSVRGAAQNDRAKRPLSRTGLLPCMGLLRQRSAEGRGTSRGYARRAQRHSRFFTPARGSADNALRIWNTLSEEQKSQHLGRRRTDRTRPVRKEALSRVARILGADRDRSRGPVGNHHERRLRKVHRHSRGHAFWMASI